MDTDLQTDDPTSLHPAEKQQQQQQHRQQSVPAAPGKPCDICKPVKSPMAVTDYPLPVVKKPPRLEDVAVCVLRARVDAGWKGEEEKETEEVFFVMRRPPTGLLAGQWEFPSVVLDPKASGKISQPKTGETKFQPKKGGKNIKQVKLEHSNGNGERGESRTMIAIDVLLAKLFLGPRGTSSSSVEPASSLTSSLSSGETSSSLVEPCSSSAETVSHTTGAVCASSLLVRSMWLSATRSRASSSSSSSSRSSASPSSGGGSTGVKLEEEKDADRATNDVWGKPTEEREKLKLRRVSLGEVPHVFSHIKHTYYVESLLLQRGGGTGAGADADAEMRDCQGYAAAKAWVTGISPETRWCSLVELEELGLTTGVKKILKLVKKSTPR